MNSFLGYKGKIVPRSFNPYLKNYEERIYRFAGDRCNGSAGVMFNVHLSYLCQTTTGTGES